MKRAGRWVQVARQGNPLFNEVLVGMGFKDLWNALPPSADKAFVGGVEHPELAKLLPVGHYVRKNLGYLLAMSAGAACIYETDDDNAPNAAWRPREVTTAARPGVRRSSCS